MRIEQLTITPPDGIDCSFGVVRGEGEDRVPKILVASFSGIYPDGSRGNSHGHYIAYSTMHGLAAIEPWCLILDFRELDYKWGNTLLLVFDHVSRFMDDAEEPTMRFPIAVVTSEKCRDAFLSLVTRTGDSPPEWHFNDIELAIEYAIREAIAWIDA